MSKYPPANLSRHSRRNIMKKLLLALGVLIAVAVPAMAQGPFADVPTDHWAYDAVNELQQAGIVIGYPDGTFGGRRAMTRYEFAVAIARAVPVLVERVKNEVGTTPATQPGVTQDQFNALTNKVNALESKIPDTSKFVTQDQFKALQALTNEFKDELAQLGCDVDALKRDVASLAARVAALEAENQRVKWNGDLNVFAIGTHTQTGLPFDRDNRPLQPVGPATGDIINNVDFVRNMNLTVSGSVTPGVTAIADINFGNYLAPGGYLGGIITDYTGTLRNPASTADAFIPYYMYAAVGLGKGGLYVGRQPLQYTPYTLRKIDVDSYTVISNTDDGNYPLDAISGNWKFGNTVNIQGWAGKTNQNSLLGNGLISQPTAGLYAAGTFYTIGGAVVAAGHAAGGLVSTTQAAGARVQVGTPCNGNLGLTYLNAAGPFAVVGYNEAQVYGADLNATFGKIPVSLAWTQSKTSGDGVETIGAHTNAYDGNFGYTSGKFGINLGYRNIGNNFGGPGYWAKLGRWTNPTNIAGGYGVVTYGISPNVSFVANGDFYKGQRTELVLPGVMNQTGDEVWRAEGGLKWGFTNTNSVNLGVEWVQWNPAEAGSTSTNEEYFNIGWGYQINPSAGFNLGYQIVDYRPGAGITPYGAAAYKGGIAVAQLNAKF